MNEQKPLEVELETMKKLPSNNHENNRVETINDPRVLDTSDTTKPKRKPRLYYIDWLRTQSVINVVLGHIWWDIIDPLGLSKEDNMQLKPWDESTRMFDYAVEVGTLHTIPMFFLVSGYLTAYTMNVHRPNGLKRFIKNRVMRIIPPFLLGSVLYVLSEYYFMNKTFHPNLIITSHLWFLYALAGITLACLPFHIIARTIVIDDGIVISSKKNGNDEDASAKSAGKVAGLSKSAYIPITIIIVIILNVAYGLIMDIVFSVAKTGRASWLLALPFCNTVPLILLYIGARIRKVEKKILPALLHDGNKPVNDMLANYIQLFAFLLIPMSMFFFLGSSPICSRPSPCPTYPFLNVNFVYTLNLILMCNLTGIMYGEVKDRVNNVVAYHKNVTQFLTTFVLLMSWAWPFFTYWGQLYMRRAAFITTYQDTSVIKIMVQNVTKYVADPLYQNGNGINWSLSRMWFWIIAMILFAYNYCNYQVNKFFHAHMTQSGMIFYIMHRCFTPILVQTLKTALPNAADLWIVVTITTYAICFLFYGLIVSNKYTRVMFGLITV
jgi:hypothetical protein